MLISAFLSAKGLRISQAKPQTHFLISCEFHIPLLCFSLNKSLKLFLCLVHCLFFIICRIRSLSLVIMHDLGEGEFLSREATLPFSFLPLISGVIY